MHAQDSLPRLQLGELLKLMTKDDWWSTAYPSHGRIMTEKQGNTG
jgi:hypothetical protein